MQDTVISTNKLTKHFGQFVAVHEITFDVKEGEIFGFLGANGAGKTTAMRTRTRAFDPHIRRGFNSRL